jgi:predicted Zn-dependent protease with MMP-like domain
MRRKTLSPKGFPPGRRFFEKTIKEVVMSLPPEFKDRLENVVFIVEDRPSEILEEWEDEDQELLGLYHGISQRDRGFWYGNVLPDRIVIYRKTLEQISADLDELRENIRKTVIHEIGHYFGLGEEELRQLEKGHS